VTDGQVVMQDESEEGGQPAKSEVEIFKEIDQLIKAFSVEIACSILVSSQRLIAMMNST